MASLINERTIWVEVDIDDVMKCPTCSSVMCMTIDDMVFCSKCCKYYRDGQWDKTKFEKFDCKK